MTTTSNARKAEIYFILKNIASSIKKHRELSRWGNVESKERLRELRARKKELEYEYKNL